MNSCGETCPLNALGFHILRVSSPKRDAKTPARGVRELDVFVDDVLVYRGVLKRAPEASQGQTVLFTNAQPVVESERHRIYNDVEESCLFIDEGSVVVESSDQRPRTAVYA